MFYKTIIIINILTVAEDCAGSIQRARVFMVCAFYHRIVQAIEIRRCLCKNICVFRIESSKGDNVNCVQNSTSRSEFGAYNSSGHTVIIFSREYIEQSEFFEERRSEWKISEIFRPIYRQSGPIRRFFVGFCSFSRSTYQRISYSQQILGCLLRCCSLRSSHSSSLFSMAMLRMMLILLP